MALKRQLQGLMITIVFMILYYAFLLDFTLSVKDSIINVLQGHNLTTVNVPMKVYNGTAWVSQPKAFDLTGFIDIAMTLAIVFAPILFIFRYVFHR